MTESTSVPRAAIVPQPARWRARKPTALSRFGNAAFHRICQTAALSVLVLAAALVIVLLWKSWLAISTIGPRFFVINDWDPVHHSFGARAFVYGTLTTSALAMFIAVPLGVGTAAFLSEVAPRWLRRAGSFLVEMLAAIPSVVYGFWGIAVLAPALQGILGFPGGKGIVPAGIILSIMIVPYVAAVSFDVCRAVPRTQREGSLALGATRWQTIWRVVLPYARPGIIGGSFLALGRALGETMAVTMLIGNRPDIPVFITDQGVLKPFSELMSEVFFGKGYSIPAVIANEFTEAAYDLHLSALIELGFVLLLVNIVVNVCARLLLWRVGKARGRASLLSRLFPKKITTANGAILPAHESKHPPSSKGSIATPRSVLAAKVVNVVMTGVLGLCLAMTVGFLLLILGYLVFKGTTALDWDFFTKLPKPVGEKGGGLAHAIYGSAMLVGLATLFAVPIGLLAAIFLVEYRSDRLGPAVRFVGELLGGVPSIVTGIFVYALLGHFSGWAGALALGIIMIPIVMRASEEAIRLVPKSLRQASFALGANHAQMVLRVSVPAALPAIITAIFLAIARVSGETAPLIMTAFNNSYWPRSPSDATPSLPYYIFTYAMGPYPEWHRQAWAAALVLLVFVMGLNFGIRMVTGKRLVSAAGAD